MPPRMTLRNILQIIGKPTWALNTLIHGQPTFETIKPYLPKGLNMKQLGLQMNKTFSGYLDEERIKRIRDRWTGKIILKGVTNPIDVDTAIKLGLDGIIVSNHGGRQLDASQAAIAALKEIKNEFGDAFPIMMDSGIRSGIDIARTIASGADFCFLGRTFMYSVAALGQNGGNHAITLLKTQLYQVLEQVGSTEPYDLRNSIFTK